MNKLRKTANIWFIFVMTFALLPVASLLLFDREDHSIGELFSHSIKCLESGRQTVVTVQLPDAGGRAFMSEAEYICGVVACVMPVEYEDEALKAQAVASYTLLQYSGKTAASTDTQPFLTKAQMRKQWGRDYQTNYTRLKALVDSVAGEYLTFDGEPVLAAYHSMSCGMTEYGANVWNGDYPYLVPVESRGDTEAEQLCSSAVFNSDNFSSICREKLGVNPQGNPSQWVGEYTRSNSGYVMNVNLCGKKMTGQKIRNAFGLCSSCFTLKYIGNEFVFDVKGLGHGVGMSQFGANQMALEGLSYRDILATYYKGTEIMVNSQPMKSN